MDQQQTDKQWSDSLVNHRSLVESLLAKSKANNGRVATAESTVVCANGHLEVIHPSGTSRLITKEGGVTEFGTEYRLLSREQIGDKTVYFTYWRLPESAPIMFHYHQWEEQWHVYSGELRFFRGQDIIYLTSGMGARIRSFEKHGCEALRDTELIIMITVGK